MKSINKEQFESFRSLIRGTGRKTTNPIIIAADKLEVGQGLHVSVKEWPSEYKTSYAKAINNLARSHGKKISVKTSSDRKSFMVLRIK